MSEFQKSTSRVLVANSIVGATETTLETFKNDAAAGEVIAVESDGTAIASGTKEFIVVSKDDNGDLTVTEPIKVENVKKLSAKAYDASTKQIDYIGFNGSTGTIDVINNNHYTVNIETYNYGGTSTELRYRKSGWFSSSASATELEIAEGLRDSLIRNFKREPDKLIGFAMVASTGSDLALGTSVDNVTFTKGSKYFTATDIDDATTNAALAVGDLIRVGTGATDAVYRITAIDVSTNIGTLDQEFQGVTTTIADTGLKRIPAADISNESLGVQLTGKDLTWKRIKFPYEVLHFKTTLQEFGSTNITESQAASIGIGEGKRVVDHEAFAAGNFGELYRMGEPLLYDYTSKLFAKPTNKYDVVSISYFGTSQTGFQENRIDRDLVVYGNSDTGSDHTNINVLITDLNTPTGLSLSTL